MKWLQKIDGNKTYILAIITGIFTIIHFIITGDYTLTSLIQLSQESTVIAMVAALRHGIAKVGSQGIVQPVSTEVAK